MALKGVRDFLGRGFPLLGKLANPGSQQFFMLMGRPQNRGLVPFQHRDARGVGLVAKDQVRAGTVQVFHRTPKPFRLATMNCIGLGCSMSQISSVGDSRVGHVYFFLGRKAWIRFSLVVRYGPSIKSTQ